MKDSYFIKISFGVFIGVWLLLAFQGLRGSDHYWYWAAVRAIVETGEFYSNSVFPGSAFTDHYKGSPFIHNIPQIYLAAIPSYILGFKWGWSVFNLFCVLGSFYLVYHILLNLGVEKTKAAFILAVWMLIPINVWMSFQPNSEAFVAFLLLLVFYVFIVLENKFTTQLYLSLFLVVSMTVITRLNFLFLFVLLPFLLNGKKGSFIKTSFLSLLFAIISIQLINLLFPAPSRGAFTQALTISQSDPYNIPMMGYYNTISPEFKPELFIQSIPTRIFNVFYVQFLNRDNFIFYSFYNIITILLLFKVFRNKTFFNTHRSLILFYFALLAVHLMTAFIFQNQFRYLYTILPASILIFIFLYKLTDFSSFSVFKFSINQQHVYAVFLVFFLLASSLFTLKVYNESKEHSLVIEELKEAVKTNNIGENESVFLVRQDAMYSFALFPRKALSFNIQQVPNREEQINMFNNIRPSWLINNTPKEINELKEKLYIQFSDSIVYPFRNDLAYKVKLMEK